MENIDNNRNINEVTQEDLQSADIQNEQVTPDSIPVAGDVDEKEVLLDEIEKEYVSKVNIKDKKKGSDSISQWIFAIIIAILISYLLNAFVFQRAYVDGPSMNPTLANGESLFEYKLGYYYSDPQRGDVVIVEIKPGRYVSRFVPLPDPDEENYVKRIVGLPGETVDIQNGFVYINGKKLLEYYMPAAAQQTGITTRRDDIGGIKFPVTLAKDEYFVLGDNRTESKDSRIIGPIKKSQLRGKALAVIFPFDKIQFLSGYCTLQ